MTQAVGVAWPARWRAVRPNADYEPTWGIEKAWQAAFQAGNDWGYPLEDTEQDVAVNGTTLKGRTFSTVGLVVWDPATGAQVIGWP